MSDPYNQYPPQGYGGYNQQPQYGGDYNQGYGQQQGQYGGQNEFGAPRRQDSYGPPAAGGFQHGQAGGQYGAYDASNPQGHAGY